MLPDYVLPYRWSEMQRDLTEIKELAGEMRRERYRANETWVRWADLINR